MIGLIRYLVISIQMLVFKVPRHYDWKIPTTSRSSKSGSLALASFIYVLTLFGRCCMFTRGQYPNLAAFLTMALAHLQGTKILPSDSYDSSSSDTISS